MIMRNAWIKHIRMISEGSWDTEKKFQLYITGINYIYKTYSNKKQLFKIVINISHNIAVFTLCFSK